MAKADKLSRDKKRERALEMYLNTDLSQKEICEIVGWTEKSFSDNKTKGDWDALKGASTITSQNIIKKLYLKMEKEVDGTLNPDSLYKIAKSIEMLSNKKVTASQHINSSKEFTIWLMRKKPTLAQEVNKYQREWINEIVSNG